MIKRMVALSLLFAPSASGKDNGQWGTNVNPELRAWFNSVTTSAGDKCCDESDGYPVEYEMRPDNHYWVRFRDQWFKVPDHAVRRKFGNPTGSGVAWFIDVLGTPVINCFVPTQEF
jgi:hypothetical protein